MNNNSFQTAVLKYFTNRTITIVTEEDEKLNNNHVLFHELPNDIIHKISNNLLDKNDKRFNKTFNEYKDDKLLKILFGDNIPELKYINPDIYNEYKNNLNLDCIKEYINKNKKFNKINCHSFQINERWLVVHLW